MGKMRFAITPPGDLYSTENLTLMSQLGCSDVIGYGPKGEWCSTADSEIWVHRDLSRIKQRVESFGLRLDVLEDGPLIHKIMLGLPDRDEQAEHFCKSLENLAAAGIRVIKPQHMPPNWNKIMTTQFKPTRGGAISRVFDYRQIETGSLTGYRVIREEEMWTNLAYFLKSVLPTAEKVGVRIALHPDDPPISPIQGFARILRSIQAFDRMLNLVPSDNIGLLFCQGCFAEMGVDIPAAIRHFGKQNKIFFAHFRNVKGAVPMFQETFHDDVSHKTNMFQAMLAYYDSGFRGPMRPDHAPHMQGDNHFEGALLGKILGLGYMKGLAESIENME
jgi:mannonate dehydratase